jgi:hypothetical protein
MTACKPGLPRGPRERGHGAPAFEKNPDTPSSSQRHRRQRHRQGPEAGNRDRNFRPRRQPRRDLEIRLAGQAAFRERAAGRNRRTCRIRCRF